jgi:hypothetical protein
MNMVACVECRTELHKAEYRKQGGGFHASCKACRKKEYEQVYRARKKLIQINKLNKKYIENIYIKDITDALISEYKNATRLNRNRIKALEKNNKPTRATKMWLNRRRVLQQSWIDGLNELITMVHKGEQVQSLREYMEIHNANNYTGLRDIL